MGQPLTIAVHVDDSGRVTVRSPGERLRIVAAPARLPGAVGQRVAELVAASLQARAT